MSPVSQAANAVALSASSGSPADGANLPQSALPSRTTGFKQNSIPNFLGFQPFLQNNKVLSARLGLSICQLTVSMRGWFGVKMEIPAKDGLQSAGLGSQSE
jgi:hypothetical protein